MILNDENSLMKIALAFGENPEKYILGYQSHGYRWSEFVDSPGCLIDVCDMYFKMPADDRAFAYVLNP